MKQKLIHTLLVLITGAFMLLGLTNFKNNKILMPIAESDIDLAKDTLNKKEEVKSNKKLKQRSQNGSYNYGEALQKAILFYEFQRSGKLDQNSLRNNWRGDSGLEDGADVGLDLTGGWYDAGDHVKFGLPMSYTVSMLGWAIYEYEEAFEETGQLNFLLDEIKWATDYLIKCHPSPNEFYYQVGNGHADHAWWGPAEVLAMERPAYKVDKNNPGSTVTGQTAASLAISSIIFKDVDPDYSKLCLKHAKELFEFADSTKSDAGYIAANGFYDSWSGFYDELAWAACWLYLATGDTAYLNKAESYVDYWEREGQSDKIAYKWAHCWDDVHYGTALLLARITNKDLYKEAIEIHLDYWTTGYNGERISYSPGGMAYLDQWGNLRYATTTAFLAFIYSDWENCSKNRVKIYQEFAESQINYVLGDNPRNGSYIVGFGENSPQAPHHRTAHGSWADSQSVPNKHRHVLYGALVGGPDQNDNYNDDIGDYVSNEVACDYNAGLVGALAKMYLLYGGEVDPNFKAIETPEDEIFVEASVNTSSNNFVEIKAILNNQSAWPARVVDQVSFRYYLDLSELEGIDLNNIKTQINYHEGAKISELKHLKDNIYYVEIDFSGTKIYPGGQSSYKKEVQFRISAPDGSSWNSDNDFSYTGLTTGTPVKTEYIPVYEKGKLIYGKEPFATASNISSNKKDDSYALENKNKEKALEEKNNINKEDQNNTDQNNNKSQSVVNSGDIKIQAYNTIKDSNSNTLYPKLKLINSGKDAIDLSKLTILYYFTKDDEKELAFWCDWSSVGTSNVKGKFASVKSQKNNADTYLEISFVQGAGIINPGEELEIQIRIAKTDWSSFNQSNDYSFNSSATDYVDWDKITIYVSNQLRWGIEP